MKSIRIYRFVFLMLMLLLYAGAEAQTSQEIITIHPPVFTAPVFTPKFSPNLYFTCPVFIQNNRQIQPSVLSAFHTPVHYTAFFCKMEVKSVKSLGIMIKVHAGDYDAYSKDYTNPQGK